MVLLLEILGGKLIKILFLCDGNFGSIRGVGCY